MHEITFLKDLATVMIAAAVVTVLFRQLKQPVVLGYILAGVLIGPHTPPASLISDREAIRTLSELGIIFLMFSLGLEFSLRRLREVGATALIAALLEIIVMVASGYGLGRLFGWNQMNSVFLGGLLAISSTTIIIAALRELGLTKDRFAEILFGILIVEDVLAIVLIALLSSFADTGQLDVREVGIILGKLSAFLGALLVLGLMLVPRLLSYVARFRSDEMLLITTVGLCFGISLLAHDLGYSVALGAFLIGAIIAEARQIARIEALTHPVRDLFSAVFFVSIGLLINPALLWEYKGTILVISVVVIVGKVAACSAGTFLAGHDQRTSLRVGMGLAQIGEFSFIIASLGLQKGVTAEFLYPIAVAVSVVTTLTTPYLIRASDPLTAWFERTAPTSLLETLQAYSRWLARLSSGENRPQATALVRKWGSQIALNLLLAMAVFIVAVAIRGKAFAWWPDAPGGLDGVKAMLWLGAMVLSLPMLIAAYRKMRALTMLLAELGVPHTSENAENGAAWRSLLGGTLMVVGTAIIIAFILALSSAILPSRRALPFALLLLALSAILLWRASIRLHARAQVALRETFERLPHAPTVLQAPGLPTMLREAQVMQVQILDNSPAAGQVIADLRLRSRTGASVIALERSGENIVNPASHEELRAGDLALLLGTEPQLHAAREVLQGA